MDKLEAAKHSLNLHVATIGHRYATFQEYYARYASSESRLRNLETYKMYLEWVEKDLERLCCEYDIPKEGPRGIAMAMEAYSRSLDDVVRALIHETSELLWIKFDANNKKQREMLPMLYRLTMDLNDILEREEAALNEASEHHEPVDA